MKLKQAFQDLEPNPEPLPAPPKSKPKREEGFTILLDNWERKLWGSKHRSVVYPVATFLLRKGRMTEWSPVTVSNIAMRERGISRREKAVALRELERLGLVKVWWGKPGSKRSPKVHFRRRCL